MGRIAINQLRDGDTLEQTFIISGKQLGTTSTNKPFLKADVSDATGQIHCRMWSISREVFDHIPSPGYVTIRGRVETYQGHLQLVADGVTRVEDPSRIDVTQLLKQTRKSIPDMQARLREILQQIKDPDLALLVKSFFDDAELMKKFALSPAAQKMHHAWLGGLLEHTLNLLEIAVLICPRYPDIDRGLVLAGLFLHDIGKTAELSYNCGFDYTDVGRLVGHVVLGTLWLHQHAIQIAKDRGTPIRADLLMVLEHIILSHHGVPEFGAAVLPKTPEAILINLIDNLDAKTQMAIDAVAEPAESANWTDYKKAFETALYRPTITRQ